MKGILIFLVIILCGEFTSAQVLNGVITRMNSGKEGIAGVQIISMGANPVISNTAGRFQLLYQYKSSGSGVALQIEKAGFEIVNKDALFSYLGSKYDTLKIYLCQQGELDSLRIKYYDISVKNIKKRYEEEIAKLNVQDQQYRKQMTLLEQQLKVAISQAEGLAQRFSVINLDDCSELFKNAFHLFEQGKIEDAINALPDSVIEAQIRAANFQIREAEIMDSIAREKKGKALEVIKMIQSGRNLTKTVMDSLQRQTFFLLQAKKPGLNALILHADIVFCLREWESAGNLYEKAITIYGSNMKDNRTYLERFQFCKKARLKK